MHYRTLIFLCLATASLSNCDKNSQNSPQQEQINSPNLIIGQKLFAKNCARCHGRGAKGTDQGPPFIHDIYKPGHHNDASFYRAVEKGVRAHHWQFGDMPPITDLPKSDLAEIINYVRHEQRKSGIH